MSKRHLSSNKLTQIGNRRIGTLTTMASEAVRNGRNDRACRYVQIARRVGSKTRTNMPSEFRYCKECYTPLIPGLNCTVRLTDHRISETCGNCGNVYRRPYLKEQRQ